MYEYVIIKILTIIYTNLNIIFVYFNH